MPSRRNRQHIVAEGIDEFFVVTRLEPAIVIAPQHPVHFRRQPVPDTAVRGSGGRRPPLRIAGHCVAKLLDVVRVIELAGRIVQCASPCRGIGPHSPGRSAPTIGPPSAGRDVSSSNPDPAGRSVWSDWAMAVDAQRSNCLIGSPAIHLGSSLAVDRRQGRLPLEAHALRGRQGQRLRGLVWRRLRSTTHCP